MPGVSTRAAIQNNHSRMVETAAAAGRLDASYHHTIAKAGIDAAIAALSLHP